MPTANASGVRQDVNVISIGADGQTKTAYENKHDGGDTVSVTVADTPPFVVRVYIAGTMVKQITVPSRS